MRRRRPGFWYGFAVVILKPLLTLLVRRDWRGLANLPATGGFVIAPNHTSYSDALMVAHLLHDNDRPPRFLGKESLFRLPFVGRLLRGAGQIPVYRETRDAQRAFRAAAAAVRAGECVVIYPEATLTRDPDLWPMAGKTGAARVALTTGCPVIPVAQWGPHELLPPNTSRPNLRRRHTMHLTVGAPVDLSPWQGQPVTTPVLRAATEAIMAAITRELEPLRGETAPLERFDARAAGLPPVGRPTGEQR